MRKEVDSGRFREDLLYRVNVITLQLPPLRERKDDIPALVEQYLKRKYAGKSDWRIEDEALQAILTYDWPGNIRELENVLERATIVADENIIRKRDLSFPIESIHRFFKDTQQQDIALGSATSLKDIEKAHLDGVLRTVHWDKKLAAKILDISLKTLYTKIQSYNLKEP